MNIEIGTRVSYEDMANPLRVGSIVGEVGGEWAVVWDDEYVDLYGYALAEVGGVHFHATVTKHMLDNAAERQRAFRAKSGGRCGGWDAAAIESVVDTARGGSGVADEKHLPRHRYPQDSTDRAVRNIILSGVAEAYGFRPHLTDDEDREAHPQAWCTCGHHFTEHHGPTGEGVCSNPDCDCQAFEGLA